MAAANFGEGLAGAAEGLAKAASSYSFHTQLSTKIDEALAATEYKENEGVLLFVSAHFHKSGNGMFQGLTCYSLGTFTSRAAAMAKAGEHQRAPSMYAHFDGYERRTSYEFLPPGAVKNPFTSGMKGALALKDSGCCIM